MGQKEGTDALVFYSLDPVQGKGAARGRVEVDPGRFAWSISPDGRRIAVVGVKAFPHTIRIVSLFGGSPEDIVLKQDLGALWSVAWASDGRGFFATTWLPDAYTLIHVDPSGAASILLRNARDQWLFTPVPSPDGLHLAFGEQSWESNVWMLEDF